MTKVSYEIEYTGSYALKASALEEGGLSIYVNRVRKSHSSTAPAIQINVILSKGDLVESNGTLTVEQLN